MSAKLMIVEDERLVALDLRSRLEDLGYSVVSHEVEGRDAVAAARQTAPDLVLMDINLGPGLDGIDVADSIRTELQLPVVFLTALSDEATLRRARLSEPFGYVLKPVRDRELRIAIEMALYKHRAESERLQLIRKLEDALAEVKTLSGLLPICAHCKRIRDDQGYWTQIETYIARHSEASFTHGICQSCAARLYPELMKGET